MSATSQAPAQQKVTRWEETDSRSVRDFLQTESGSAGLLLAATIVALVWANSPLSSLYEDLWGTHLVVDLGGLRIDEDLRHWVNDGLMAFFFYLVGLEIRRELALGELRDRRAAAIPVIGALAGMAVPALLYVAVNAGGPGAGGWGIVMATDIAFVLGVVALLGDRCPPGVRVFLLTLAIVDDIGAVTVIAVFYSSGIELVPLVGAAALLGLIVLALRLTTWRGPAYMVAGLVLWALVLAAGIHPTIAGVALGLVTAVHPPRRDAIARAASLGRVFRRDVSAAGGRATALEVSRAVSPNERFQGSIHPWTSYAIVPLFALANAGVALGSDSLSRALTSPITLGVIAGLVAGKALGISLVSLGALKAGVGILPVGVGRRHLVAGSSLAGIGFTVSLFVAELAFTDEALREEAKIGVLLASALAAAIGWALFRASAARATEEVADPTRRELEPASDARNDHHRGRADAPVTLVEFGDYSCPHTRAAEPVLTELREQFGDRLDVVFRHLPIEDAHPDAPLAAEAAEAAGAQGRFWEMHDRLMADSDTLPVAELIAHAEALDLDVDRFSSELQYRVHAPAVAGDVDSARRSGAPGTPAFYLDGELLDPPDGAGAWVGRVRERMSNPV